MQVLEKARLINRHQGAQAHGDGGKLPELRHELRVRIARQALAVDLLTEIEQLLLAQAPFKVSARVDTGRDMALDVDAVAAMLIAFGMPEMVEASTEQMRQRGKRADVTAQVTAVFGVVAIGLDHHGHGIPAHVSTQSLFDLDIARAALLLLGLDRVDIARIGRKRHVDAVLPRLFEQLLKEKVRALGALALNDGRQGVEPFARFLVVFVLGCRTGTESDVLGLSRHGRVSCAGFCRKPCARPSAIAQVQVNDSARSVAHFPHFSNSAFVFHIKKYKPQ